MMILPDRGRRTSSISFATPRQQQQFFFGGVSTVDLRSANVRCVFLFDRELARELIGGGGVGLEGGAGSMRPRGEASGVEKEY